MTLKEIATLMLNDQEFIDSHAVEATENIDGKEVHGKKLDVTLIDVINYCMKHGIPIPRAELGLDSNTEVDADGESN